MHLNLDQSINLVVRETFNVTRISFPHPCTVLWTSGVLWVLWSLSPDRVRLPPPCYHRRRRRPATVTSRPTCNYAKGSTLQRRRHKTQCTAVQMHACMHTQTHLGNHDSGSVWVTITEGDVLRLLKYGWVIILQSTVNDTQGVRGVQKIQRNLIKSWFFCLRKVLMEPSAVGC